MLFYLQYQAALVSAKIVQLTPCPTAIIYSCSTVTQFHNGEASLLQSYTIQTMLNWLSKIYEVQCHSLLKSLGDSR